MTVAAVLAWWNLLFILPFAAAVLYYVLLAAGVWELEHDHDVHVDHDHPPSGGALLDQALTLLGIGRAPLSIVLTTFCLVWGFVGFATSYALDASAPTALLVPAALVAAATAATIATRSLAALLSRLVPRTQSYGIARRDLKGRTGQARFPIGERFGSATVVDQNGFPHEVDCRVRPGQSGIPVGTSVVLTEYDPKDNVFYVMSNQQLDDLVRA
jgi:hypothetical protein